MPQLRPFLHFSPDLTNFKNTIDTVGTTWNGPTERLGAGNQHVVKGGVVCRDVIVKFDDTAALNGLNLDIASNQSSGNWAIWIWENNFSETLPRFFEA